MKRIVVTGGAGFIGSNFVRYLLRHRPRYAIAVLDKLTYAGNMDNLMDVQNGPNFKFIRGDICDRAIVDDVLSGSSMVINFAAETHVDRSILDSSVFIQTNVYGVSVLLESARNHGIEKFVHISTDEVYGSRERGSSREDDPLRPSNPYSASKAAADMLALSYCKTYGVPVTITRSSNGFGPHQYPEKLIPLFITNALEEKKLPLYGDGLNVRDWVYVEDLCEALDVVLHEGQSGEVYNIGATNERTNLEIAYEILKNMDKSTDLLTYIQDRPAHDRRYSVDWSRIQALGWQPRHAFEDALEKTVAWYRENEWWWRKIKDDQKAFQEYYETQYSARTFS